PQRFHEETAKCRADHGVDGKTPQKPSRNVVERENESRPPFAYSILQAVADEQSAEPDAVVVGDREMALRRPCFGTKIIRRAHHRAFDAAAGHPADDALTSEVVGQRDEKQANARRGGREIRLLCALYA